jgi:DNA-binding winged helix-turn-helix (wHTH) protein
VKTSASHPPVTRFGVFELDLRSNELRKQGMKIRLQGQPVEILAMLLERPGETVTREELQKRLWPADTFVDFEQGLNNAMKRLRAALDDNAESPHFIETLPRRGYRFIGAVTAGQIQTAKVFAGRKLWKVLVPAAAAIAVCVIALAGVFTWIVRSRSPTPVSELQHRQLTSSSVGNAVASGAISPDGKYLAYVDPSGVHVQLIASGDTQTVSRPESLNANATWLIASWLPDSTSFLANAMVHPRTTEGASIWMFSLFGRVPKRIRDNAIAWSVSPDGTQIAFATVPGQFGSREIWLMTSEGEQARKFVAVTDESSGLARVVWSPDGKRIGYLKFHQVSDKSELSIETRDLAGGPPRVLLTNPLLHDFYWLPDGRVVYSIGEGSPTASENCNLWQVRVNAATGAPIEPPRRLTNWAGI